MGKLKKEGKRSIDCRSVVVASKTVSISNIHIQYPVSSIPLGLATRLRHSPPDPFQVEELRDSHVVRIAEAPDYRYCE